MLELRASHMLDKSAGLLSHISSLYYTILLLLYTLGGL